MTMMMMTFTFYILLLL